MTSDSRRLAILTAREIHDLYGLPCFSEQERCVYFDLSPAEHDAVKAVHFLTKLIDTSAEHLFAVLEHE
jgi:hypothetical protein